MKNNKNFLRGACVLLITAIMISSAISVMANTNNIKKERKNNELPQGTLGMGTYVEGFEGYEDFILDFPPWTQIDYDQGETWGMQDVEWPNMYYNGSFMIFNPYQTTPPIDNTSAPHSGNKYASCWDVITDMAPNDDWLISPQLALGTGAQLTFWGKSINDNYGLEEIEVGISTTDTDSASFEIITGNDYISVPPVWTEYSYDLSQYNGMNIYIGFHVVSWDIFAFFLDDISVTNIVSPDLESDGSISWVDVEPGSTISDTFTVSNVGETGSRLSWYVLETPDFGNNWIFSPAGGSGLTPADGPVTVTVTVDAPLDERTEFTGEIKIVNSADSNDFKIIQVSLVTPKVKMSNPLLQFLENHPNLFPILQQILGL
jgi:hypothetical protein